MRTVHHTQHEPISRVGVGVDTDVGPSIHHQSTRCKSTHIAVVPTYYEVMELNKTTMKVLENRIEAEKDKSLLVVFRLHKPFEVLILIITTGHRSPPWIGDKWDHPELM